MIEIAWTLHVERTDQPISVSIRPLIGVRCVCAHGAFILSMAFSFAVLFGLIY